MCSNTRRQTAWQAPSRQQSAAISISPPRPARHPCHNTSIHRTLYLPNASPTNFTNRTHATSLPFKNKPQPLHQPTKTHEAIQPTALHRPTSQQRVLPSTCMQTPHCPPPLPDQPRRCIACIAARVSTATASLCTCPREQSRCRGS